MNVCKENYTLEIDGKGRIVSLTSSGKQFSNVTMPLFQFRLRNGADTSVVSSDEADEITVSEHGDRVTIKYTFESLLVNMTAVIDFGSRIEFGLEFENNSGKLVEWIDYPQIAVPNDLVRKGGSGRILIDINEGLIVEDLEHRERTQCYKELEYPSEGLNSMFPAVVESQFLAYYDDTCGLYFAAEDPERSIKGINFCHYSVNSIKLLFRLYPGVHASETEYKLPYPMVFDFFSGDWYDAAELYRNWFKSTLPDTLKKTEDNDTIPEWYKDSPLIVTYPVQGIHDMDPSGPNKLFPYCNALPYIDDIAALTESRILTVLMHWEGTAMWAPPYVWPPLGGEKIFKEFCDELHKRNFMLGVYCSGIGYTIKSNINSFNLEEKIESEDLKRFMCAPPGEGEPWSRICQAQRKSYDMCISQEFTKNVLTEEAEKMASSGLDYIQLFDQNHGGTPYFCFGDHHGHPPVPGKWMVENMNDLLRRVKGAVGDNVLLGCESAASEAYIPYLNLSDNRFNLNYSCGRPVPLYGYLYHEYLQNFSGNSVCSLDIIDINKSPDCHLLRVAHSYLAGDFLTLVINQDGDIVWSWGERDFSVLPERQPILDFIKVATKFKRGIGKKYLTYGKMIKPSKIECESVPMFHARFDYKTDYPAVLTTAWEASDGERAQFFASYRKKQESFTVYIEGENGAELYDENGNLISALHKGSNLIQIPPCSVRMIAYK